MTILIPARAGSKGLPFKNRKLFEYTANIIPREYVTDVYVITDDIEIQNKAFERGFNFLDRPDYVSNDIASTQSLMKYVIKEIGITDNILMLYLTYPERTWTDVTRAIDMYTKLDATSLLCKKKLETTPFLMLKEESNSRGSQLFYHDLYRRQDYPKCFEISHFISIFNSNAINNLNNNMYNQDTVFMEISDNTIDIDTETDFNKLNEKL